MTEAVIVAHGLWMPGWETFLLRRRLAAAGFEPHLFRFATVRRGLTENAALLARFASDVPGDVVHYVGYSLGGVVAVEMLASARPTRPGRAVCLASPLAGSRAAAVLARFPAGRRIVGRSLLELLERGGLAPWDGARDLGVIAGGLSLGAGRLLGALPAASDGTVAVDETRLAGLRDHIVLPVTHTSILFARPVARQIAAFLRHGAFTRTDTRARPTAG